MILKKHSLFSPPDLLLIEEAVKKAEQNTSGQIVPVIVDQSDPYEEAPLKAALGISALFLILVLSLQKMSPTWNSIPLNLIVLGTFISGVVAAFLATIFPSLRRHLVSHSHLERKIHQRAAEAFISHEVFNTKERTGILIFMSLLERRVLIIGDSGIHSKVKSEDWDQIIKHIIDGIKNNKALDGLIKAIDECGLLLQKTGFTHKQDGINELSDTVTYTKD